MIPLGAFELQSRLGHGGMGEVWRGVHAGQHVPVAVKLLTNELARKSTFRAAFRNEVRAVAGLDHPNIVLVFDYGTVDEETQAASDGALRAGTPWLAMELAEDGSLEDHRLVRSWPQLRGVLLALLDALAHAHARGVVHRDIKPGNVLVAKGRTLKLTDFGLAHAMDQQDGDFVAGTPSYMAPEQFEGRWRDYGPWTDLYAVGCLTHALCSGSPPFGWIEDWHTGHATHRELSPPPLRARFRVPDALSEWVQILLAKDPRDRWRRCADAASALLALPDAELRPAHPASLLDLGGPTVTLPAPAPPDDATVPIVDDLATPVALSGDAPERRPASRTIPLAATTPLVERPRGHSITAVPPCNPPSRPPSPRHATQPSAPPVREADRDEPSHPLPRVDSGVAPVSVPGAADARPPLPSSWRRPDPPARSPRLVGAGLGLFGLRTIPLVGRRSEQDTLWDALTRVETTGEAHVVVVHGPSGCGKTRLGRWICERAHEVGAASVISGRPDAGQSPEDVLAGLLVDWLRCRGLDRGDAATRISAHLAAVGMHSPRDRSHAVSLLLDGTARADRRRGLVELLVRLAAERPLVVCLDDAHVVPGTLDLARALLDLRMAAPILWITTVSDEARTARQAVSSRLLALRGLPRVRGLSLGPLAEVHRAELVRQLLGLESHLAVEVERRTGGHPLFAVQLVGEWVQRGLLEPGRRGFRLKDGALPDVPDDLRQVWAQRIDRFLHGRSLADAVSLELAAVLGHDVAWEDWEAVCDQAGLHASGDLIEALLAGHLARCGSDGPQSGWSFQHGLVREALEARAQTQGRLADHHARCAAMLTDRDGRGVAERRARHLLAAEHPSHAIAPLLAAIDERLAAGDHAAANVLLTERDRALQSVSDPMGIAEGQVRWGRLAARLGRLGDAQLWGEQAVARAREERWGRVLVDGLTLLGGLARQTGDTTAAWRLIYEAEQLAMGDPTRWRLGLARLELGRLQAQRGHFSRAAQTLRFAREDLEAAEDLQAIGEVFLELAEISIQRGRTGAAAVLLGWAHNRFRWLQCRLGVARCHLSLARVARFDGRLDSAAEHVHDAVDELRSLGTAEVLRAELELGRLAHARGDASLARERASGALRHWDIHGEDPAAARAHGLLLALEADAEDVERATHHAERMEKLVSRTGLVDRDLERLAAHAAERLVGEPVARRLRTLAATWRDLRLHDEDAEQEAA